MAREQFEGKLIHTQVRPDGPAGRPMTQALFHATEDDTPAVAVWHAADPPENLEPGATYTVTGDYVHHKDNHYFFRPVVELIQAVEMAAEAAVEPERMRRLLFRPRDWRRLYKVIASVSLGLTILLAGLIVSYASGRSDPRQQPASQAVSSNQADQAGEVAASDTPAQAAPSTTPATPASTAAADCVSRVSSYGSTTRQDSSLNKGTRRTVVQGVTGNTTVCYPNGRDKPAVETVTRQPVTEVIAVGTKTTGSSGPTTSQPTTPQPSQPATTPTTPDPKPVEPEPEPEPETTPRSSGSSGGNTTNMQGTGSSSSSQTP